MRLLIASLAASSVAAFVPPMLLSSPKTPLYNAKEGQAEVVLVGCGAPNRGMGWYHAVQMLENKYVRRERLLCIPSIAAGSVWNGIFR